MSLPPRVHPRQSERPEVPARPPVHPVPVAYAGGAGVARLRLPARAIKNAREMALLPYSNR